MTLGCYRRRERDCVFDGDLARPRTCVHCSCPESERSFFKRDLADERATRARLERAGRERRASAMPSGEPSRISEALGQTRAELAASLPSEGA